MNSEFEKCLKRNKIKEFSRGQAIVPKELKVAKEDLDTAKKSFSEGHHKWCTIQAYYSMFHSARALLYEKNYREHSHYCLIIAMRALYVEERLMSVSLVEALQKAKRLREDADYYSRWSDSGAESILKSAEEFFKTAKKLTQKNKE